MAKILIVDDHPDTIDAISLFLRQRGHEVRLCVGGAEALGDLLHHETDCMVLDLNMPQVDGIDVLEVIRSYRRFANLPVVVLTALGSSLRRDMARKYQPHAILTKGHCSLEVVAQAVEKAVAAGAGQERDRPGSADESSEPEGDLA